MLTKILVPLDGSALAEAALPYAQAIARRTHATVVLVRNAHVGPPLGDQAVDQHRAIVTAETYLNSIADVLVANGIAVESGVPFGGSAASWIVEESDIRRADLVIMATHDRIGPDRWVHGSVAEAVVSHSTVPVMLVRGSSAEHLALRFDTQNRLLVVPVDGSDLAASALPVARELAQQLGAGIVLVAVVPRPGQLAAAESGVATHVGSEQARLEAEAWAYLEASVGQVGASNVNVTTALRRGEPALEIAAAAEEYAAAATVMATHGRTGLVRSLVGSVAGAVLHHSSCPVVLHRPGVLRGAEQPIVPQPAISVAGD